LPGGSVEYGFSWLLTYTVLDQDGNVFAKTGYSAQESVYAVTCNPPEACQDVQSETNVDHSNGTFCDVQSFATTSTPPPQQGEYLRQKQNISITTSGHLWVESELHLQELQSTHDYRHNSES